MYGHRYAAGYGVGQAAPAEPPPPVEIVMLALAVLGLVHEAADPMLSRACRAEFIGVLGKLSLKDLLDPLTRENLVDPAMVQQALASVPDPTKPLLPPRVLASLQQEFGTGSEARAGASLAATLSQILRSTLSPEQTSQLLGRLAQQDAAQRYAMGAGGYAPAAGYATGGWFWPALAGFLLGRWTH
jgi:hypothetical protein